MSTFVQVPSRTPRRHGRALRGRSLLAATQVVAWVALAQGCTSETALPRRALRSCFQNSDCAGGLVCALGACRSECTSSRDCEGGACVNAGELAVCQTAAERNTPCDGPSACPAPLGCASDFRCRNLCYGFDDCNAHGVEGRVCVVDQRGVRFCADPEETLDGVLSVAPATFSTGVAAADVSSGPVVPSGARVRASFVGPEGGTLGLGAITLTLPPGALAQLTPITLAELEPPTDRALGWAYAVGPMGLTLDRPAQVSVSAALVDARGLTGTQVALSAMREGRWQPLDQQRRDGTQLVGALGELGVLAVVDQRASAAADVDEGAEAGVTNAGAPCSEDSDCEGAEPVCLGAGAGAGRSYPDGYCSARCTHDDVCNPAGGTAAGCPFASDRSGLSPASCHARCTRDADCRGGYACATFRELYAAYGFASASAYQTDALERYCVNMPVAPGPIMDGGMDGGVRDGGVRDGGIAPAVMEAGTRILCPAGFVCSDFFASVLATSLWWCSTDALTPPPSCTNEGQPCKLGTDDGMCTVVPIIATPLCAKVCTP